MTTHDGIKVQWGNFEKIAALAAFVLPIITMVYYFGQEHQGFVDLKETITPYLAQTDQNSKDIATMQGQLKNYSPIHDSQSSFNR